MRRFYRCVWLAVAIVCGTVLAENLRSGDYWWAAVAAYAVLFAGWCALKG